MGARKIPAGSIESIVALYRAGHTLAAIGDLYDVTRERIRQLLWKAGVEPTSGGCAVRSIINKARRDSAARKRMDQRRRAVFGCDLTTFIAITGGRQAHGRIASLYVRQKENARKRGISWELTLPEWMHVWRDSGHWDERGRGAGSYCMARHGDVGPYSVANVYITTCAENVRHYQAALKVRGVRCADGYLRLPEKAGKADGRPRYQGAVAGAGRGWTFAKRSKKNPYQVVAVGRYVGCYATEEAARAAYLAACEEHNKRNTAV